MQSAAKNVDPTVLGTQIFQAPPAPCTVAKFQQILIPVDLKNDRSASIHYAIRCKSFHRF